MNIQEITRLIWRFAPCLFCVIAIVFGAASAQADSSVWRVTSGNNTLYLGGTLHFLRSSDYPLPPEYETAYTDSTEIYFETDISTMGSPEVQEKILQELTYNDERSLKTVLSDEVYQALSDYVGSIGMSVTIIETFKPGMVLSVLTLVEFQKMGFTPQGVDAYYNVRVMGDGKSRGALETNDEQISFLAALGEGNESELIRYLLQDLEQMAGSMEGMISAWRSGDTDELEQQFIVQMKEETPDIYDSLLRQRNLRWIPQIEEMLGDSDTEFVLVGVAHLVGSDGLLEILQAIGYEVTQL